MGEIALSTKNELESLLGFQITEKGNTYVDDEGAKVSVKSCNELNNEMQVCSDKLETLLSNGAITEEQYIKFDQQLDYIYGYYISISRGKQINFRKISDDQFYEIETHAYEENKDFELLLQEINSELRNDFQVVQEEAHKSR